jgi:hypothetical protein
VRIVAHLVLKDLRAVAGPASLFATLIAIDVVLQLTGVALRVQERSDPPLLAAFLRSLPFAELGAATLLVPMLIQLDPLVDARAFWLTRPIPRGQLFAAKLIVIGIVVFTPALSALGIQMAWHGVPPLDMLRAGFELVLWFAFPLLLLVAIAAALCVAWVTAALTMKSPRAFEPPAPQFSDPASRLAMHLLLIGGFFVTLYQFYRRRDWRVGIAGFLLTTSAAFLLANNWPGVTLFTPLGEATGAWADPAKIRLRALDQAAEVVSYSRSEISSVAMPIVLDGLPDGYSAAPFTLEGRLTRADGAVFRTGHVNAMQISAKGDHRPSLSFVRGNGPITPGPTDWEGWPVLLELLRQPKTNRGDDAGNYAGVYHGMLRYRLAHHQQVARLPVSARGRHVDGPRSVAIEEARDDRNHCFVTLEVSQTDLTLSGPREPTIGYYFIDRRTGEKLRGMRSYLTTAALGALRPGTAGGRRIYTTGREHWQITRPSLASGAGDVADERAAPCANLDMIVVRTVAAGWLTRSLDLPDFRVNAAQDALLQK